MSKSKEQFAARATQIAARARKTAPSATAESSEAAVAPQRATPRAKPVRVTADLAPHSYRSLVAYCADLAETLGRAKVPHVEVIRALIKQLEDDANLQGVIASAVRETLED